MAAPGKGYDITAAYRSLDARDLYRRGMLEPGLSYGLQWSRSGRVLASVGITTTPDRLTLSYRHLPRGGEPIEHYHPVTLDRTPCTYGGARPWFLCPDCGWRVALLYLGRHGCFACRHCLRLNYKSQRESPHDRLIRRAEAIRQRLGWPPGIANAGTGKPRGMLWRTYWRLLTEHERCANGALAVMAAQLEGLGARCQPEVHPRFESLSARQFLR